MSFISRLRRSRQHRVSILSAYLVHPFPLRGTSPQGETRALRDWLSVSHGMISTLVISRYAAPPYPAAPDFLHGKACHTILRSLCSLTNRVPLPPHPGGQNKTPRDNLLINPPLEMTMLAGPPLVISTEAKRSGEISPSDGTGGITAGNLSTRSIMGAVPVCLP